MSKKGKKTGRRRMRRLIRVLISFIQHRRTQLNQGKDIMTLYFAMPYDTFTTPMETRDVSTIPTGIKKLLMVAILPTTKRITDRETKCKAT